MGSPRMLIIGLDGASPDLMFDWMDAGFLPNLQKIAKQGVAGTLASIVPPVSPPAWTAFMTGTNPGKNGIFDFVAYSQESYLKQPNFVNSHSLQSETIWEILSRQGHSVGVLYHPLTYPPMPVNGFMVSGFMAPRSSASFTYPPELRSELEHSDLWKLYHTMSQEDIDKTTLLSVLDRMFSTVADTTIYMLDHYPVDCFMVVMHFLDTVSHFFWDRLASQDPSKEDIILAYYKRTDQLVGELYNRLSKDTTLVLMSDHGFGPTFNRSVRFNEWLRRNGYLSCLRNNSNTLLTKFGINRSRIKILLKSLGLGRYIRNIRAATPVAIKRRIPGKEASLYDIDWQRTRAYFLPFGYPWQGVWINTRGVKPQGIVEPGDEYNRLREELLRKLSNLTDPETSKPIIEQALKREDVYNGCYTDRAPDILLKTSEQYHGLPTLGKHIVEETTNKRWKGIHRMNGFWLAKGPGINRGQSLDARIIDLAPTILHILNTPVPSDMDGKALKDIFDHKVEIEYVNGQFNEREEYALTEEETEELTERLRMLGYL